MQEQSTQAAVTVGNSWNLYDFNDRNRNEQNHDTTTNTPDIHQMCRIR